MNPDFVDNPSGVRHPRPSRSRHQTAGRGAATRKEDRIRLDTIGRTISILDVTTDPQLSHLMSEDACWRFAYEQWMATRPARWHREQWQQWQNDRDWLRDKLIRIEDLARELGFPPRPAPRPPWHRRVRGALRRFFLP